MTQEQENKYYLSLIDESVKTSSFLKIGDTFTIDTDSMKALCTIIGFDKEGIPIVRYEKVRYKEIFVATSKYGKGDYFKDGDIFVYAYDLKEEDINKENDLNKIQGITWEQIIE